MKNFSKIASYSLKIIVSATLLTWGSVGQMPHNIKFSRGSIAGIKQAAFQIAHMNTSLGFAGGLHENLTNIFRNAVGMIVGYSSHQNYVDMVCNGTDPGAGESCDGPPENGIVGTISTFINELPTVGKSAGITSCQLVPSSGTATGTDSFGNSIALTFEVATHKVPAGWVGGGVAFEHRVTFTERVTNIGPTAVSVNMAYEFNCGDSAASYAAISMSMDEAELAGYERDIAIFNGPINASTNGIQLFMAEHNPSDATKNRTAHAVDIHYNPSTNIFSLWGIIEGQGDGHNLLSKVNANGNYSTGKVLISDRVIAHTAVSGDNTGKVDAAALALAAASDASLEADPLDHSMDVDVSGVSAIHGATYGSPATLVREACVDLGAPNVANAPAHADCSSFSLVEPVDTAPALDASGTWSIHWAAHDMAASLENL